MDKNVSNSEDFKSAHGYILNDVWYPRVTSIVSIKAKPALYRFYGELSSFAEGEAIKQKSADEGTLIHEVIEKILIGESPTIPESIAPSIKAAVKFIDQNGIKVDKDYVEKRIINHKERYTGTVDALALIDGKFGVLDIKTSQEIYRDYNLQTAAYFGSLIDELPNLQTRWILRIDQIQKCMKCGAKRRLKGGREKIRKGPNSIEYCRHEWSEMEGVVELKEFPHWKHDYEAFLGAKKLWEWENLGWLKKIGYL